MSEIKKISVPEKYIEVVTSFDCEICGYEKPEKKRTKPPEVELREGKKTAS